MQADRPPLTLTIPSDNRMLSVARAFIEAACQVANLDKSVIHAVVLATGEAFTNIVRHAHEHRPNAKLQIQCCLTAEAIEILFHDEGEPFDVTKVPHLEPGELRLGGRGVYLMRTLMDELGSSPRPGGGNTLRMVKRRFSTTTMRDCG
jgi:serine/threonine-protein kinase RsbW